MEWWKSLRLSSFRNRIVKIGLILIQKLNRTLLSCDKIANEVHNVRTDIHFPSHWYAYPSAPSKVIAIRQLENGSYKNLEVFNNLYVQCHSSTEAFQLMN